MFRKELRGAKVARFTCQGKQNTECPYSLYTQIITTQWIIPHTTSTLLIVLIVRCFWQLVLSKSFCRLISTGEFAQEAVLVWDQCIWCKWGKSMYAHVNIFHGLGSEVIICDLPSYSKSAVWNIESDMSNWHVSVSVHIFVVVLLWSGVFDIWLHFILAFH